MSIEVDIREIGDDDLDAYYDIRAQAFGRPDSERATWRARVTADQDAGRLGAYLGTELVGGLRILPGAQWLNGRAVPMGGLAAVVVRPEHRGQGVARRLLFASLDWMRDQSIVLSTLHPASTRVYRSGGWEIAGAQEAVQVKTRSLAAIRSLTPGLSDQPIVRLTRDDWPLVRSCYARVAPSRHGFVARSESFWLLREPADDDGWFTYGIRADNGLAGYVRYQQVPGSGWGYRFVVDDFIAPDRETAAALWRFLGAHAMQAEHIEVPHACIDQLVLLLDEQDLTVLSSNRWMARIIDVAGSVAALGYPTDRRGSVSARVQDPWPHGVSGVWDIEVGGGEGVATRRDRMGDADLSIDVGALSAVMLGRFSASTLHDVGRVQGARDVVQRLDQLFDSPIPQLADDF